MSNNIKPPSIDVQGKPEEKRTPVHAEKRKKQLSLLLSIAIAIVVWGFVIQTENPTTQLVISNVPVTLQNENTLTVNNLAISGDRNYTIKVVLEGKRTDVFGTKQSDIEATADLSACVKGENHVAVSVYVPGSAKVTETIPAKITITVDPLVTESKPVKAEYPGEAGANNTVGDVSISPETVDVTGPEAEVAAIEYIKAIVPYDQITTAGGMIRAEISAVASDGKLVSNVTLENNYVYVTARLDEVRTVPLSVEVIGKLSEYYDLQSSNIPNTIVIQGPASEIKDLSGITAEPIDISRLTSTTRIRIIPKLPKNVTVAAESKNLVAVFNIVELESAVFEYDSSEILLENLGEAKAPVLSDSAIKVTVIGDRDVLEGMSKESVILYVDCSKIDSSTSTLPILFKLNEKVSSVLADPAKIGVKANSN